MKTAMEALEQQSILEKQLVKNLEDQTKLRKEQIEKLLSVRQSLQDDIVYWQELRKKYQ
tara:strand:- start:309 stop:485 length:177 start_codon:yes stop_codon:yes gene_type:complete